MFVTNKSVTKRFPMSHSALLPAASVVHKKPWTEEEDRALVAAVQKYGPCRWSVIATSISTGRVGKQCRERWNNHLCPNVKKSGWLEEEDQAILSGVAAMGTRWCEIIKSPRLSGRTDNSIKNRFYSLQRRSKGRPPPVEGYGDADAGAQHRERIMRLAAGVVHASDDDERDRQIRSLTAALHEKREPVDWRHQVARAPEQQGHGLMTSELKHQMEATLGLAQLGALHPKPPPVEDRSALLTPDLQRLLATKLGLGNLDALGVAATRQLGSTDSPSHSLDSPSTSVATTAPQSPLSPLSPLMATGTALPGPSLLGKRHSSWEDSPAKAAHVSMSGAD